MTLPHRKTPHYAFCEVCPVSFWRTTTTTISKAFFKPLVTGSRPSGETQLQSSYTESSQIMEAALTANENMLIPLQVTKFRCAIKRSRTRLWSQAVDNSTTRQLTATRCRFNKKLRLASTGPGKNKLVSWTTWRKHCSLAPLNKENSKLIRKLSDVAHVDFENQSDVRDKPGCCLHRSASWWNDDLLEDASHKERYFAVSSLGNAVQQNCLYLN